jgi:hypothetical protein
MHADFRGRQSGSPDRAQPLPADDHPVGAAQPTKGAP